MSYKAKPNEPNKRGDMRGKRGKDKKPRLIYVPQYSDEQVAYWEDMLDVVQEFLYEYLDSDKVRKFMVFDKSPTGSRPPKFMPKELVDRGMKYFRFTLERRRNMAIYGLALFLGIDTTYIMRMEQKEYQKEFAYRNDIYKPIIKTFKNLVGLFHEDLGTNKINPNFHIFVLKALRSGFEEVLDINVKDPEGLSEEERDSLRKKIGTFTEKFTKGRKRNGENS